jgi:hypothetical protein
MAENEEVVEIETGNRRDTTHNQTQAAQRGTVRSNALPDNIGNLARFFTRHTPHTTSTEDSKRRGRGVRSRQGSRQR